MVVFEHIFVKDEFSNISTMIYEWCDHLWVVRMLTDQFFNIISTLKHRCWDTNCQQPDDRWTAGYRLLPSLPHGWIQDRWWHQSTMFHGVNAGRVYRSIAVRYPFVEGIAPSSIFILKESPEIAERQIFRQRSGMFPMVHWIYQCCIAIFKWPWPAAGMGLICGIDWLWSMTIYRTYW